MTNRQIVENHFLHGGTVYVINEITGNKIKKAPHTSFNWGKYDYIIEGQEALSRYAAINKARLDYPTGTVIGSSNHHFTLGNINGGEVNHRFTIAGNIIASTTRGVYITIYSAVHKRWGTIIPNPKSEISPPHKFEKSFTEPVHKKVAPKYVPFDLLEDAEEYLLLKVKHNTGKRFAAIYKVSTQETLNRFFNECTKLDGSPVGKKIN